MELKGFIDDDDAVSPVIGVIMMVAITVILAAVIATFVLGLGDQVSNTAPQATFSLEYDGSVGGSDEGILDVTHDGGDSIKYNELYVRGSGIQDTSGGSDPAEDIDGSGDNQWPASEASGSNSEVVAGNTVAVGVTSSYEVRVVFQAQEGDTSATLGKDEGPDA